MKKFLAFLLLLAACAIPALAGDAIGARLQMTPDDVPVIWPCRGRVLYVGSATGSATSSGFSPTLPLTTLNAAVAKCTANAGDVIYLLPKHAETISTAALSPTLSVAGVTVVGLGNGEQRPTFTLTHVDASIIVSAADAAIQNVVVKIGVDSVKIAVDVNSTDCTLKDIEIREGSAKQFLVAIDVNGGGANAADRCKIRGCRIIGTADGPNAGIELGEVADEVEIAGCFIDVDAADAGIHNPTGKILTNLLIKDCIVANRDSGEHAIELVSACTGFCTDNRLYGDTAGTILDPGSLKPLGNLETAATDVAGTPTPYGTMADKIDGITMVAAPVTGSLARYVASGGTALGRPLPASTSLVDVIGNYTGPYNGAVADDNIKAHLDLVQAQILKVDGVTMGVPVANSLAAFVASGGTGLGRQLPASTSLVDLLGNYTGPYNGAVADDNIKAHLDLVQAQILKADGATLSTTPTSGSLATFVASGGTALGRPLPASTSLVDIIGNYTGPYNGAVADDNVKAHLDLVQAQILKVDGVTMGVPVANSLAAFVASGGTGLGRPLPASTSLVDIIGNYTGPYNGAEADDNVKAHLDLARVDVGTRFWIKKTLTSSAVVQGGVDVTGVSSVGELAILAIIVKSDGTGLVAGTNFEIESNNVKGKADIFVEAIATIGGANKTVTLLDASVTKVPTILEVGKKLLARSTVADCTGAGTVDIYVQFERLTAAATIAAAP